MRILLANYRYFASGGPERYMFNLTDALTEHGHEVIPFSIRYAQNLPSLYEKYFVSPTAKEDQIYFRDQSFSPVALSKTLSRLFYAPDVENSARQLAKDTQPDIAYLLIYLRKLSPSLIVGLKKSGLPVVVRLSEYSMLCPAIICFRDGHTCQLCVKGNLFPSIVYRCVQNRLTASLVNAAATYYHRFRHYFDLIDCFITPTHFMYEMMLSAGYPAEKLKWIPTFVDSDFFHPEPQKQKPVDTPYFLYAGRMDYDKGVHILLDAWRQLKSNYDGAIQLKIAGTNGFGTAGYVEHLMSLGLPDVFFLGEVNKDRVADLLRNAYVTILPSIWFDNLPNAILESYASGTAVISSNIGSFRECVVDNETGLLFKAGDPDDLAQKMRYALDHPEQVALMSQKARIAALEKYSRTMHLSRLESLFKSLIKNEHG